MRSTQSTSKTTCSARTSPTDRATVMMGSGHSGGRFRPTNRIGGSYTGPGFPVTVSPRPAGAPHTGDQRHASSGWGEAPLVLYGQLHIIKHFKESHNGNEAAVHHTTVGGGCCRGRDRRRTDGVRSRSAVLQWEWLGERLAVAPRPCHPDFPPHSSSPPR